MQVVLVLSRVRVLTQFRPLACASGSSAPDGAGDDVVADSP